MTVSDTPVIIYLFTYYRMFRFMNFQEWISSVSIATKTGSSIYWLLLDLIYIIWFQKLFYFSGAETLIAYSAIENRIVYAIKMDFYS